MRRTPTLLVIEDAQDQATLAGMAARRAHPGLDVRIAHEGARGVAYLAGVAPYDDRSRYPFPDLLILDLLMPDVDGFAVLRWIGKHLSHVDLPVVVLTGSPNPAHETRARYLGARAVFRKPDKLSELGEVVQEIIDNWIGTSDLIGSHIWGAG